jgi:hypothetical protein
VAVRDPQARKGAENQSLIREVNERIEELAGDVAHLELLCECADPSCIEVMVMSVGEYEAIRSSPVRFPVKPGHADPDFERVIEENGGRYVVVEKFGDAAEVARQLDPRSR